MKLSELLSLSKAELYEIAKERKLDGRGSMSKEDLIITLAEESLEPEQEEIIRASTTELHARAREMKIKGYSKLDKAALTECILDSLFGALAKAGGLLNDDARERERAIEVAQLKANRERRC